MLVRTCPDRIPSCHIEFSCVCIRRAPRHQMPLLAHLGSTHTCRFRLLTFVLAYLLAYFRFRFVLLAYLLVHFGPTRVSAPLDVAKYFIVIIISVIIIIIIVVIIIVVIIISIIIVICVGRRSTSRSCLALASAAPGRRSLSKYNLSTVYSNNHLIIVII